MWSIFKMRENSNFSLFLLKKSNFSLLNSLTLKNPVHALLDREYNISCYFIKLRGCELKSLRFRFHSERDNKYGI